MSVGSLLVSEGVSSIFQSTVSIVTGISVIGGFFIVIARVIKGFAEGQKALLRAQMLKTYYKHQETKVVPQYELENFWKCYNAYKALGGNSFIDDIKSEVETWHPRRYNHV